MLSIKAIYNAVILKVTSKKITGASESIKINNDIKIINIVKRHKKRESYITDIVKEITISDIKKLIPKNDLQNYKIFTDKKEADKFNEDLYGNWCKSLIDKYSDNNISSYRVLSDYVGSTSTALNTYLRYGGYDGYIFDNIIKNIDICFSSVPRTDQNIIVFRGFNLYGKDLKDYYYSLKEGDMLEDKAYKSTSLILDIATSFKDKIFGDCFALLVIKIPKGENCISLNKIAYGSRYSNRININAEYEMLIHKDKSLKLEKILVKNYKQIVLLCTL